MPAQITTSETLVNTTTTGDQWDPTVTMLADGGWVVVWMGRVAIGSETGIFAQRYDSTGNPVGGEFQVNSASVDQWEGGPSVAALPDGGWIVTWCATSPHGGPSPEDAVVYYQRYDSTGAAVGPETQVNTPDGFFGIMSPDVTVLADGGWVIVWMSQHSPPDPSLWNQDIYGQRFDSNGAPVGGEFLASTSTGYKQHLPSVTALDDGGWVVTWMSEGQDGSGWGVYSQRYNADGSAAGGETLVTATVADQREPHLATLDDGGWVITWHSNGQDGSGYGIFAQRYDSSGAPVGGEFQVNTTTANDQLYATVEALPDGGWAIAWLSITPGSDPYGGRVGNIYVQRYDADGNAVGDEILVGTASEGSFSNLSTRLAALPDGSLVVTWGQYGTDGSGYGVYALTIDAPANVINGTEGDDTLVGTSNEDVINGLGGNDLLIGLQANDSLDGGDGDDTLQGGQGDDFLYGGAGADLLNGNPGDDTLDGGDGDDLVVGGPGNDTLLGGAGHDFLRGDNGDGLTPSDDYIDGGAGFDRATFYNTNNGVTVSLLLQGTPQNTGQGWDTLVNVEAISGSIFSDVLTGDDNDNWFTTGGSGLDSHTVTSDTITANGGDDLIIAGFGNHNLNGGSGVDTVGFAWIGNEVPGGVTVSLGLQGAAQDTGQGSMTLSGFENLSGSGSDDVLTGDSGANVLAGNAGSDVLTGGEGNDVLLGDGEVNMSPSNAGPVTIFEAEDYALVDFYDSDGNVVFLFEGQDLYDANGNQLPRTDLVDEFGDPYSQFVMNGVTYDFYVFVGSPAISDGVVGNDILDGGDGDDTLIGGGGNDTLFGGAGNDLLDGGAGTDTVGYGYAVGSVHVDLSSGLAYEYDGAGTLVGSDTLIGIEKAAGGNFDDTLIGDGGANELDGFDGNDVLDGGAGDDNLDGNTGDDTVHGGDGNDFVLGGDDGNDVLTGGAGDDIVGGDVGNDVLNGDDGNDFVLGGDGDDLLAGGAGGDVIAGGAGVDTVSYADSAGAVDVVLYAGLADEYDADGLTYLSTDSLAEIENVIGSPFDDAIQGDGQANLIQGLDGNDFLIGMGGDDLIEGGEGNDLLRGDGFNNYLGPSGNDIVFGGAGDDAMWTSAGVDSYNGGDGFDRVSFFTLAATQAAVASLITQTISNDGFGNAETMVSVEALGAGTAFADQLTGDDNRNFLLGDLGDTLIANGGDDMFQLSGAPALLDGGSGIDTIVQFTGDIFGSIRPDSNGDGLAEFVFATQGVHVDLSLGMIVDDGLGKSGTLVGIENVGGSGLNDRLVGDGGSNELSGYGGNDTLDGGKGDDSLYGGGGDDVMTGGAGADRFVFADGSGNDRIVDFKSKEDLIVFDESSGVDEFGDLVFTQMGKDVLVSWGTADSILLAGVKADKLAESDFEFAGSALTALRTIESDPSEESAPSYVIPSDLFL